MKKILIVEDDPRIAFALCTRLKAHGHKTWMAEDATTALNLALSHRPDLIVLDIALTVGNGFDLGGRLRQLPETCRTPLIVATASADPRLSIRALEIGAVALLRKPYNAGTLLTLVRHSLAFSSRSELPPGAVKSASPSAAKPDRKRILIVEDDEKVARALALRIQAAGFEASVANDGFSGVRSAVNLKPDAIVLDISLPAGDGFSVAERIQANLADPIPLIFLTASKRQEFRQRAHELGAVGFFEKPYHPEALLAALNRATGATA